MPSAGRVGVISQAGEGIDGRVRVGGHRHPDQIITVGRQAHELVGGREDDFGRYTGADIRMFVGRQRGAQVRRQRRVASNRRTGRPRVELTVADRPGRCLGNQVPERAWGRLWVAPHIVAEYGISVSSELGELLGRRVLVFGTRPQRTALLGPLAGFVYCSADGTGDPPDAAGSPKPVPDLHCLPPVRSSPGPILAPAQAYRRNVSRRGRVTRWNSPGPTPCNYAWLRPPRPGGPCQSVPALTVRVGCRTLRPTGSRCHPACPARCEVARGIPHLRSRRWSTSRGRNQWRHSRRLFP